MVAVATLVVIVAISVLVTRVATSALTATGLSSELAKFQARSAFTGVGYTTNEAESVAGHPVRRKIALVLMLLSNAGIASVVASLILGFSGDWTLANGLGRIGILVGGLGVVIYLANNDRVAAILERMIERGLQRWTDLESRDVTRLLNVSDDYSVNQIVVERGDWLHDRRLVELDLSAEGIQTLGLRRSSGEFVPAADEDLTAEHGDALVAFGPSQELARIGRRRRGDAGDQAHERAVERHRHRQDLRPNGVAA